MYKWLLIFLPSFAFADIGLISEFRGNGEILRLNSTDKLAAELKLNIFSNDDVRTGNGRIAIEFVDDSVIRLTEHSKVIIDKFVFDPNPEKSELALSFIKGTGRFVTGKLKRIKKENIKIRTGSATIGIRGTDFTISVDEIGRSLVILLPNPDGTSSGEITVSTFAGTVIMNQPFQATMVTVAETLPTKPIVLTNLTLDFIDNLLIVNPPQEIEKAVEDQNTTANNVLDVDLLEETELEKDYLEEEFEEINRLNIDLLNVDFLTDLLDIIDDSVGAKAQVSILNGVEIEGVKAGFDPINQSYTFVEGSILTFFRAVENTIDLELDKDGGYNVDILSAGKEIKMTINGGGDVISINQSN